jgi:excisionase family DNA binding protein
VLTVDDAAALLQVDAAAVLAMAQAGELPGRRVGEQWRFSRTALLRWLGGDG